MPVNLRQVSLFLLIGGGDLRGCGDPRGGGDPRGCGDPH